MEVSTYKEAMQGDINAHNEQIAFLTARAELVDARVGALAERLDKQQYLWECDAARTTKLAERLAELTVSLNLLKADIAYGSAGWEKRLSDVEKMPVVIATHR